MKKAYPRDGNLESTAELLVGFFHFYAQWDPLTLIKIEDPFESHSHVTHYLKRARLLSNEDGIASRWIRMVRQMSYEITTDNCLVLLTNPQSWIIQDGQAFKEQGY